MLFLNQTEVYVLLAVCAAAAVGIIAIIVLSIWILIRLRKRKELSRQASEGAEAAKSDASDKATTVTSVTLPGSGRPYSGTRRRGKIVRIPKGALLGAYVPYPIAAYSPYYMYFVYPNAIYYYDAGKCDRSNVYNG